MPWVADFIPVRRWRRPAAWNGRAINRFLRFSGARAELTLQLLRLLQVLSQLRFGLAGEVLEVLVLGALGLCREVVHDFAMVLHHGFDIGLLELGAIERCELVALGL